MASRTLTPETLDRAFEDVRTSFSEPEPMQVLVVSREQRRRLSDFQLIQKAKKSRWDILCKFSDILRRAFGNPEDLPFRAEFGNWRWEHGDMSNPCYITLLTESEKVVLITAVMSPALNERVNRVVEQDRLLVALKRTLRAKR